MSYSVSLRPQALDEIRSARQWYDAQRAGLGGEFQAEVDRVVELLAQSPLLFPTVHARIRRAMIRRFPYGVFFHLAGADVVLLSCYHLRRRPRRWGRPPR